MSLGVSAWAFSVGHTIDNHEIHDLFSTTDTDIDRQFRLAETKLGAEILGSQND